MGNVQSAAGCVVLAGGRSDATKALLRCAEAGDVVELGALLECDARGVLHSSVFGGNTAWHKAAKGGRADVLEALRGAVLRQYERDSKDVAAEPPGRPSVLRLGGSAGDAVARLINKANMKGCTPLMLAAAGGHTDAAAWLIKHGARRRGSLTRARAKAAAAAIAAGRRRQQCRTSAAAARAGADVWRHDRVRRHTALHCAAEAGATDVICLLLARAGGEVHPGNGRT